MNTTTKTCFVALTAALTGCSYMVRTPEDYEAATAALLATRNADISQCYTDLLQGDQSAQGKVAVRFIVEAKTGSVKDAAIEPSMTTAPDSIAQCVLAAVSNLTLDPPDQKEGQATFVWTFTAVQSAPAAPPAM